MAGQYIQLGGVRIPAGASAPRIIMTEADRIAASMPALEYAMSPRELVLPGVNFERNEGRQMIAVGTAASLLETRVAAGQIGLGTATQNNNNGLTIDPSSPKVRPKFSFVHVAYLSGVLNVATNTLAYAPVLTQSGQTFLRTSINEQSPPDTTVVSIFTGIPNTSLNLANNAWHVFVGGITQISGVQVASTVSTDGGEWEDAGGSWLALEAEWSYQFGYHTGSSGLRNSLAGDTYTFSDDLTKTAEGKAKLMELVAALKSQYGIE